jgi:diketogulonate reductase-like aldo/keto reductase
MKIYENSNDGIYEDRRNHAFIVLHRALDAGDRRLGLGGTDEKESIRTVHAAVERGIILTDVAALYVLRRSEEIVGMALERGCTARSSLQPRQD